MPTTDPKPFRSAAAASLFGEEAVGGSILPEARNTNAALEASAALARFFAAAATREVPEDARS